MSFQWIASLVGGTTVLIYIAIALFAPSLLNLVSPIVSAITDSLKALGSYLWGGFLYLSKSVPAMALVIFVVLFVNVYTVHRTTVKVYKDVHTTYNLTKKKDVAEDTNPWFRNPLSYLPGH